MRKLIRGLAVLLMIVSYQAAVQAQATGSISGTVIDPTGALVPNATVVVKGEGGQEFTVTTTDNGTYRIPAVQNGIYTVTITASGFKTSITTNVKVDVGIPTTVDAGLEIGNVSQVVEITSGGEVLQTQTATVGTTLTGRQITETPIASRDALDLVALMPGNAQSGAPRRSSINGLPKGALSITIDGVDVQDNLIRSSDGYFTFIRPRVDAIEEVTVSTANPGAESTGDGAVQIRFVTKRGTNNYRGSAFWQHRDETLNANYFFLNRDGARDENGKARRPKLRLNQFGTSFGGPLPFLRFGEGGNWYDSGKDKAFFFFNYEEFRQPQSIGRTRVILNPAAQAGNFSYITSQGTKTENLYDIAARSTVPGTHTSTPDPTVGALLTRIRAATATEGTITAITNDPNRSNYNFVPQGNQVRKFLALRFDFNLTKSHSLEFVLNRQLFPVSKDFINSIDERFPGFPSYGQGSTRRSYSTALRSTFGQNIVNEARFAVSGGESGFAATISPADFAFQGGYSLGIDAAGITTATSRNSSTDRSTPTYDFTDSVSWIKGNHSISFGGQYKLIRTKSANFNRVAPTVTFGLDTNDPSFNVFQGCTVAVGAAVPAGCTLPNASAAQVTEARNLYATLVGRVLGYTSAAYLTSDGTYKENALLEQQSSQKTLGLFAQDTWRIRPSLTVNYGLRWQPQTGIRVESENYSQLESFDQVFGVSGPGNVFRPGTFTGTVPRVVGLNIGDQVYPSDYNNFAPSVGVVWSPNFGEKGLLRTVFGEAGKSVFRGGFSTAFVREGLAILGSINGANPGGTLNVSRSLAIGNLTRGTNLRDPGNPNVTAATFSATPAYPLTLTSADSVNVFAEDLKSGKVHSFSFGYQRELDKNTVIEVRYVGNRGSGIQRQANINEFNTIENGLITEYRLAQANLYANISANNGAGRCQGTLTPTTSPNCQYNIAYFGPGTGTSPLPITLAYLSGSTITIPNPNAGQPGQPATINITNTVSLTPGGLNQVGTVTPGAAALNPSAYSNANFRSTTFTSSLNRVSANPITYATNLNADAARRQNAINSGLPSNFFLVNPTTPNGSFVVTNDTNTWYDSAVIEVRRRLSSGLRLQANYVLSKAMSNGFGASADDNLFGGSTQRDPELKLQKNVQAFDIRHQFKLDATYDLPFGRGRTFFSGSNALVNSLVGGFTLLPAIRWQSGSPAQIGGVQLIGMTREELQKEVKVRKNAGVVTFLPDDIILNTQKAFATSVTTPSGYATTFGEGGPTGRFIAPVGFNNCQETFRGDCGFTNLIIYGPSFFKFDLGISKKFGIGERRNIELRANILDVLNRPNFRIGGWGCDICTATVTGTTAGQLGSTTAYQDINTTNDPGGRVIDLILRINF